MSKLAAQDIFRFIRLQFGKLLASQLKDTRFTPIHVTLLF
jgi:hypothetical protein